MNTTQLISTQLTLLGVAFLASSFLPLRKILTAKESPISTIFGLVSSLIAVFLCGFLVHLYVIFTSHDHTNNLYMSAVCFLGGLFVLLVLEASGSTIDEMASQKSNADHLATHDELTGMANRRRLLQALDEHLEAAKAKIEPLAVIVIDFDRFKDVNDELGHAVGDQALTILTDRIRAVIDKAGLAGRLGGDEFAVILPRISPAKALQVAENLHAAITQPCHLGERFISLDASIGVASFPVDAEKPPELLRCADLAMLAGKKAQQSICLYDSNVDSHSHSRLLGGGAIREGLANREFSILYQPKFDLKTMRVTSVEALVRWHSKESGIVGPDSFIPLAERVGLIRLITNEVLRLVMTDVGRPQMPDVRVWVNLSAHDLVDASLPDRILDLAIELSVSRARIGLEMTETAMLVDQRQAVSNAHALVSEGISLAIDDFGTGYSTLSHLAQFPVTEVKLDKEFIRHLDTGYADKPIIKSCIDLAHDLAMVVTAEGVEKESQLSFLKSLGCDMAQGFLLAKPMPVEQLVSFCRSHSGTLAS